MPGPQTPTSTVPRPSTLPAPLFPPPAGTSNPRLSTTYSLPPCPAPHASQVRTAVASPHASRDLRLPPPPHASPLAPPYHGAQDSPRHCFDAVPTRRASPTSTPTRPAKTSPRRHPNAARKSRHGVQAPPQPQPAARKPRHLNTARMSRHANPLRTSPAATPPTTAPRKNPATNPPRPRPAPHHRHCSLPIVVLASCLYLFNCNYILLCINVANGVTVT